MATGSGSNTKITIELLAEAKKLQQTLKGVQKEVDAGNKKSQQTADKTVQRRKTELNKILKSERAARKEEQTHQTKMMRVESQRHRQQLTHVNKLKNENQKLSKSIAQGAVAGGRGGQTGQGREREPGAGRRLLNRGLGIAGGAAAFGGYFLVNAARQGYELYKQYQQAVGANTGMGTAKEIRAGINNAPGARMGYSRIETAQQVGLMGRATGALAPRELQYATRATGMEAGEVADVFGTLRRAGYDFQGTGKGGKGPSQGGNEFKKLLAAGTASGLEKVRFPEFAQGVQSIVEQQRTAFTGKIDAADIAKTLAMWGATGRPGMQGAAGANLFGKVTGAIANPRDEYSQSLMLQSMGFGKPGGNTGYYAAEKRRESAGRDPTVVMDVMKEFKKQFGGGEEGALAMRSSLGVTLEQAEALQKIYESTQDATKKQEDIKKIMDEAKPIDQQALDASKKMLGMLEHIAGLTDKGIALGSKAAPVIEGIEKIEQQLLTHIVDFVEHSVPKIITGIKEIVDSIKLNFQAFMEFTKNPFKFNYKEFMDQQTKGISLPRPPDDEIRNLMQQKAGIVPKPRKSAANLVNSITAGAQSGAVNESTMPDEQSININWTATVQNQSRSPLESANTSTVQKSGSAKKRATRSGGRSD